MFFKLDYILPKKRKKITLKILEFSTLSLQGDIREYIDTVYYGTFHIDVREHIDTVYYDTLHILEDLI
jgi:hypothetical protein